MSGCRAVTKRAVGVMIALVLLGNVQLSRSNLEDALPHVDECSVCMSCHVDTSPAPMRLRTEDLLPEHFMPTDVKEKQLKPFCEACKGCTHHLHILARSGSKYIFNRTFHDEAGASNNWLFTAATNLTASGRAIVKVACIPVGKIPVQAHPQCLAELTVKFAKIYLALEKLVEECDLTDIIPKVWVQPISAVLPEIGYHIRWHAIWMEQADGISLENLVRLGNPMMHPNDLLDIMHNRLNKTQVVKAAIFDLMTSQCDRHAQNIFIGESGHLTLIDNERALYENGWCAMDSIFLPATKKFTINVMENAWVNKFKNWGTKVPQCWANVPLLLDYRCYVPGGQLGTAWPTGVQRCLAKLAGMSAEQIMHEYGFPNLVTATALKNRTKAMHEDGFESAMLHSYPVNPSPWRYRPAPSCCKIIHTDMYRCGVPWNPDTAIPFGDPIGGLPWRRDSPDPGSLKGQRRAMFEGGLSRSGPVDWLAMLLLCHCCVLDRPACCALSQTFVSNTAIEGWTQTIVFYM
ncbi:uncharacterized protein HaLaN_18500 [Haematococcus lacustris]|uniref:PI3K/PI4K catalytic domain-containing protein n=1 Tax=Haematococcus lacustris TaxID=44745 RepID=A0A699ZNQ3_HAELA|nr:uncharacterized protein HaLaN_18500 [Haematococcus lacustris]